MFSRPSCQKATARPSLAATGVGHRLRRPPRRALASASNTGEACMSQNGATQQLRRRPVPCVRRGVDLVTCRPCVLADRSELAAVWMEMTSTP